jgi:hypothetical protein
MFSAACHGWVGPLGELLSIIIWRICQSLSSLSLQKLSIRTWADCNCWSLELPVMARAAFQGLSYLLGLELLVAMTWAACHSMSWVSWLELPVLARPACQHVVFIIICESSVMPWAWTAWPCYSFPSWLELIVIAGAAFMVSAACHGWITCLGGLFYHN